MFHLHDDAHGVSRRHCQRQHVARAEMTDHSGQGAEPVAELLEAMVTALFCQLQLIPPAHLTTGSLVGSKHTDAVHAAVTAGGLRRLGRLRSHFSVARLSGVLDAGSAELRESTTEIRLDTHITALVLRGLAPIIVLVSGGAAPGDALADPAREFGVGRDSKAVEVGVCRE